MVMAVSEGDGTQYMKGCSRPGACVGGCSGGSLGLREAVTNVIRHARARRCRVTLVEDSRGVRLTIEDDGLGGEAAEGAGLSGMRTRLAEVGGSMERDVRHGTRLTLVIPRKADPARAMVAS